jgi:hypothetical protein
MLRTTTCLLLIVLAQGFADEEPEKKQTAAELLATLDKNDDGKITPVS